MSILIRQAVIACCLILASQHLVAQPFITSFSPVSGPAGSTVLINGTGFDPVPSGNIVYFGAARAVVTAASASTLTVTVPSGATAQPLTVTSGHLTAQSGISFNLTYPAGNPVIFSSAFAARQDITTLSNDAPQQTLAADFDGDGHPDILNINRGATSVAVYHNTGSAGNPSFDNGKNFFLLQYALTATVGDLDGDGRPDIIVTDQTVPTLSVLHNSSVTGNINFDPYLTVQCGVVSAAHIAIGDLDGDGKPEVVLSDNGQIVILKNNSVPGTIQLDSVTAIPVSQPNSIVINDLDGDGKADLAVLFNVGTTASGVLFIHNNSTAGSLSLSPLPVLSTVVGSSAMLINDLDGDGRPDMVLANYVLPAQVSLFRNTSSAGSISFSGETDVALSPSPVGLSLGDIDGDGLPELVAVLQATNFANKDTVTILKNNSVPGNLAFSPRLNIVTPIDAASVFVADVDGDGKPDLVTGQRVPGTALSVYRNRDNEPYIRQFSPLTAFTGEQVTIKGVSLTGTSVVQLGGMPAASFTVVNDSVITATVSSGGASGSISVKTVYGSYALSGFEWRTVAAPVISSFAPVSAPPGASVTISGANFDATAANNIVYFGGMRATVTGASSSSLTVTVPTGAGYCNLTVTTNHLSAWSKGYFSPSFSGAVNINTSSSYSQELDIPNGTGSVQMDNLWVGDLDGDGKPDVLARGSNDYLVSFLNTGKPDTAMLRPTANYLQFFTNEFAVGDMDGDGKQDIVYCSFDSGAVVYTNASTVGKISFVRAAALPDRPPFYGYDHVAIGDVDGDGKPDLACWKNNDSNVVMIYRNSTIYGGRISFDNGVPFGVGKSSVQPRLYLADVDGDGKPEVIMLNTTDNTVSVLKNICTSGVINFAPKQDFFAGSLPQQLAIGDIDGDGKPELVITDRNPIDNNTGNVGAIILQNNSTATGISFVRSQSLAIGIQPLLAQQSTFGDMDGDGKPDLVISSDFPVGNTVSVFPNQSSVGNISFGARVGYPGTGTSALAVDLNGDGYTDIVGVDGSSISIFKSQVNISPDSYIPPVITSFTPLSGSPGSSVTITGLHFSPVASANTVYFGGLKAVITAASATSLTVTVPKGAPYALLSVTREKLTAFSRSFFTNTFSETGAPLDHNMFVHQSDTATEVDPQGAFTGNAQMATGDLDGDGKADLVISNLGLGTLSVYLNNGQGGKFPFTSKTDYTIGRGLASATIMDVDGDGKLDIVAFTGALCVLLNTGSQGVVSFAPLVVVPGQYGAAVAGWAADFDGDGRTDILGGSSGIYRNITTAGVVAFEYVPGPAVYEAETGMTIGDYDQDGKPDIAVTHGSTLSLFRNITAAAGEIQFVAVADYPKVGVPGGIVTGDIDGDQFPDIVVTNRNDSTISVFRNIAAFNFSRTDIKDSYYPEAVAIGDLNGDGKPDLAVVHSYYDSSLHLFKNTSVYNSVSFDPAAVYTIGQAPVWVNISDWNTDGAPDLLATGSYPSRLYLLASQAGRPVVTGFTPNLVAPGGTITITGFNFSNTSTVTIGGRPVASYTIQSDHQISAVVGEGTEGYVLVGNAISSDSIGGLKFVAPVITAIAPLTGPVGTTVQITGNHFSAVAASNNVYFGPVKGQVTNAAINSLTVKAPAGADLRHISISLFGEVASSSYPFDVSFGSIGNNFSAGSFSSTMTIGTGDAPQAVASGDLDGDGLPDLVVGNFIFRNTGAPGMITLAAKQAYSFQNAPYQIVVDDIDGDGRLDILRIGYEDDHVAVFLNTTTSPGAITLSQEMDLPLIGEAISLAVSDVDGDGKKDILGVSDFGNTDVRILLNKSVGNQLSFVSDPSGLNVVGLDVTGMVVDDLDGDKKPDIVLVNSVNQDLRIFRNTGVPGALSFSPNGPILNTDGFPLTVTSGDLDGDGKPELIVGEEGLVSSSGLLIFKNQSSPGSIAYSANAKLSLGISGYSFNIPAIGDWDGDGRPDVAMPDETSGKAVALFKNTSPAVGSISFQTSVSFGDAYSVNSIVAADLDKDGKPEIVAVNKNSSPGNLYILRNQSGEARVTPSGAHPVSGPVVNGSTVDATVQTLNGAPYVQRHYDIQPVNDPANATATVTLFFTQDDFNAFNASPNHGGDLPTGPNDNAGKANLRVYQYHGFSVTGQPGTYSGGGTEIDPADNNIVWNVQQQWWEVSFDVNGFSGFFLSSVGFAYDQTPAPVLSAGGVTRFCSGGNVLLSSSAVAGNQWYKDGHLIAGADTTTYLAVAAGVYTATATHNGLVSPASAAVTVLVDTIPAKPVITLKGSLLQSSVATGDQWYLNGNALPGATGVSWQPTVDGLYTVGVTAGACAATMSDAYSYLSSPVLRIDSTHYLTAGPNPFKDQVILRYQLDGNPGLSIRIFDMQGRLCYSKDQVHSGDVLSPGGLAKGIYILRIFSADNKVHVTIRMEKD